MRTLTINQRCNPPTSTGQASNTILKRKDGSMFVGKKSTSKGASVISFWDSMLLPHQPETAFDCPLSVSIILRFPFRKSETKRNREKIAIPHTSRPDVDNLVKILLDRIERLSFIRSDSLISILHVEKYWHESPGFSITIEEILTEVAP